MNRNMKLQKLANAIRDYRGTTYRRDKDDQVVWIKSPKETAIARVVKWLDALKLDVALSMLQIDAFQSYDDFNAWFKKL